MDDLLAQQETGDWFPFVRAWSAELLAEERLLAKAREVAGLEEDVEVLMQWKDAVLKFADVVRPALLATRNTLQLEPFRELVEGVGFDAVALSLARGELRSRTALKEQLGDVAGTMFEQILLVDRTSFVDLEELEEEISDPSDWALRLGRLKRHKRMLDLLSQENRVIDLTIRDGDDEEERQAIIDCQNTLRGFATAAGLNARGTPKRATTKQEVSQKDVGKQATRRTKKKVIQEDEEEGGDQRDEEQEEAPQTKKRGRESIEKEEEERQEEEEQEEEQEEEEEDWKAQLHVELDEAECSTAEVLDLLAKRKEDNIVALEMKAEDPDKEKASASAGARVAGDAEQLRALLRNESPPSDVKGWGKLLRWWRIVDKSYVFRGLMEHLRAEVKKSKSAKMSSKGGRPKKKQTLEDAWNDLVKRVRGRLSFKQASYYDRIGAFLLKFPGFVWQVQLTKMEQLTRTFKDKSGARARNFTAVLKDELTKEEKEFWGSLENIRQYHARMRPMGELPNGTVLRFKVEKVPGNGDCGFTVIGIPRDEAADALLEHLDDGEIRNMIGMEIQSMLRDDQDGAHGLPDAVLDEAISQLLQVRIDLQTKIDAATRGKKSTKKLDKNLHAVEEEISKWCRDKDACERFINSYLRNAEKEGYLQTAVREIGSAYTSLDALARIYGFCVGIWQPDEDGSQVKFIGWINEQGDGETVHMLHDGGVHFDALLNDAYEERRLG